jgi:phosphoadenosine phosphosulfate reductase
LLQEKGPNSFFESVDNRKECCYIRKVAPLTKALKGNAVWITGLRAEQSENRNDLQFFEYDEKFEIIKFNPLLKWTLEEVQKYIDENNVPQNALHKKGFVSIGCAPCTRAIAPGEDIRAGRWSWESSHKECGLHQK